MGGAGLLAWALGRKPRALTNEIDLLFSFPVATYGHQPQSESSVVKPEEAHMMSEENAEKAIIRLQERYSSQEQQLQRLERLIEGGQRANTEALDKLAQAFNTAFQKASADYVTKQEFQTVRNLVYGAAGTMLLGVLGALLTLVVAKQ